MTDFAVPAPTPEDRFQAAIADLETGHGPESPALEALSHLQADQLARFSQAWEQLAEPQKLGLLDALKYRELESLRLDFNAIYQHAMQDENLAVRRRAIESTVEDDSSGLLHRLLSLMVDDQDASVRAAAARGLEPFAQRGELDEMPAEEAARLRRVLFDTLHRPAERIDVRADALVALGYYSGADVAAEISTAYQEEALRLHAIKAMGHTVDPRWLDTLLSELESADDALRQAAAISLGELGEPGAVFALIDLIDDPAMPVRLAAISALGEIGGDEAREALVYSLEDKRPAIRQAAAAALEELDFFDDPLEL